jgi:hypothetical protein
MPILPLQPGRRARVGMIARYGNAGCSVIDGPQPQQPAVDGCGKVAGVRVEDFPLALAGDINLRRSTAEPRQLSAFAGQAVRSFGIKMCAAGQFIAIRRRSRALTGLPFDSAACYGFLWCESSTGSPFRRSAGGVSGVPIAPPREGCVMSGPVHEAYSRPVTADEWWRLGSEVNRSVVEGGARGIPSASWPRSSASRRCARQPGGQADAGQDAESAGPGRSSASERPP